MAYIRQTFSVQSLEQAKNVVLSSEIGNPEKFIKETQFLINVISQKIEINEKTNILDFGCGMGRVSKELVTKFKCKIIGVDASPSMLQFAKMYVNDNVNFTTKDSYSIRDSIDVVISIFVLQHVEKPKEEIDNIVSVLKPNGIFILLNENVRCIPNNIDRDGFIIWDDDGFDVFEYVETKLKKIDRVKYMDRNLDIIFYRK